jgi:UDP-N-acetylmuramoyl-tripeptide--D-alanyl-D-alanine ligase
VTGPAWRPLHLALEAMGGTLLVDPGGRGLAGLNFAGVATDNRQVTPGRLFFALKGERVDGYEFSAVAVASGAAALVVPSARGIPPGVAGVPVIGVPDTRTALAELARAVRRAFTGKVVGITGSNGKTTTKELVAAALDMRAAGGSTPGVPSGDVLKTAGNFNTEIGLPLTVMEASGQELFWVLEMAMRGRGEIAYLADIAVPDVGLVTNVAAAHLGRLGSLEEVARAKGEIFSGLAPGGIAVLPADEPLLEAECRHLPESRKRRFGGVGPHSTGALADRGDVQMLDFVPAGREGAVVRLAVGDEPVVVRLPLAGEHNARNAAAALAVVQALGLPARQAAAAMARVELPAHRSRVVPAAGRMVLDDCYNANPASMAAALQAVRGSTGGGAGAYAVLGDMLELGPEGEALHEEIGHLVAGLGFAGLVTVGPLARRIAAGALAAGLAADRALATDDPVVAARTVLGWSQPGDWILVKASRGLALERVLEALQGSPP